MSADFSDVAISINSRKWMQGAARVWKSVWNQQFVHHDLELSKHTILHHILRSQVRTLLSIVHMLTMCSWISCRTNVHIFHYTTPMLLLITALYTAHFSKLFATLTWAIYVVYLSRIVQQRHCEIHSHPLVYITNRRLLCHTALFCFSIKMLDFFCNSLKLAADLVCCSFLAIIKKCSVYNTIFIASNNVSYQPSNRQNFTNIRFICILCVYIYIYSYFHNTK